MDKLLKNYQTPMYIFDMDVLKERVNFLKEHLPGISLCYAMKANPFIVKDVESSVERIEVCSPGEYYICRELGVSPQRLVISGVYKTPEVIEDMIVHSPHIGIYTIESLQQLSLLDTLSKKYQRSIQVFLRLTSGNQFGLDLQDIEKILNEDHDFLHFIGIQYFSGTQKTSIKRLKKEIDELDCLLEKWQDNKKFEVLELEYGPGFPVEYFEKKEPFDEIAFLKDFSELVNQMHFQGKVTLELGRSIAASCGQYVTKVVDVKTNKNQNYAIIDGGMHQLVYYGQMMAMKHPQYEVFPLREGTETKDWNLCGSLCSVNDILVKNIVVSDLKIGDYFIFHNTGAYCMTEGISLFLSRELPQVILIRNHQPVLVRDTFQTYQLNMGKM